MKQKSCAQVVADLCAEHGIADFSDPEIGDACSRWSGKGIDAFKDLFKARWSKLKKALEEKEAKFREAEALKARREQEFARASAKSKEAAAEALKEAEDKVAELEKQLKELREKDMRCEEIFRKLQARPTNTPT